MIAALLGWYGFGDLPFDFATCFLLFILTHPRRTWWSVGALDCISVSRLSHENSSKPFRPLARRHELVLFADIMAISFCMSSAKIFRTHFLIRGSLMACCAMEGRLCRPTLLARVFSPVDRGSSCARHSLFPLIRTCTIKVHKLVITFTLIHTLH